MKSGKTSRILGFQLAPFALLMISTFAPSGSPAKNLSFDIATALVGVSLIQVARQEIGNRKHSKDGPPPAP